ncbi:hypothetical protein XA68_17206 [Ophiocordyceps unilateralis]|uniref:Uncharacterized protein n=1 Tax=Ophiocordyceps unilateralis TaxID=268505 RepID=A0A2A9PKC2_OPHUN|nr:hypothetical protein XA68_17206 [Ophiocordyceps unilateralis]
MIFSSLATAVLLAAGCQAAVVVPRLSHLADFRLFSGTNCGPENLGIWTIVEGDLKPGECKAIPDHSVVSIKIESISKDCQLTFHKNAGCGTWDPKLGRHEWGYTISDRKCLTVPTGNKFRAFTISCQR